ncbi:hypothetical protein FBU31_005677, partial [Coemansia sp. 'formosensis']
PSDLDGSAMQPHTGLTNFATSPPLPFTQVRQDPRLLHPIYTSLSQLPLASQPWSPGSVQGRSMHVGSESHYILPHRRQSMLANLTPTSRTTMNMGQTNVANEELLGGDHRRRSEASIPPHRPDNYRSPPPLVFIPANIEKIKRTYNLKPRERPQKPTLSGRARSPRSYEMPASNSRCHLRPPSKLSTAVQTTILPPLSVALQQHSQSPSSMQLSLSPIRPASVEEAYISTHNMSIPTPGPAYNSATPYLYDGHHEPSGPLEPHRWSYEYHPVVTNLQAPPQPNRIANEHVYRQPPTNFTSPTTATFNEAAIG